MSIDEQEKNNEDVYKKGYIPEPDLGQSQSNEPILKDGDSSPCPFCLDDVTNKDAFTTVIAYTIFNDSSGQTNHTEIYHFGCYKEQQRMVHGIQARKQNGR